MAATDLYRGDHLPQVGADILKLKSFQLQKLALIRIAQLTSGEVKGTPLEPMPGWPKELGNCWKLYFDEKENDVGRRLNRQAPRFRIVYRFLEPLSDVPGRDLRPRLQVLAVGARYQSEVYERAVTRLARPEVSAEPTVQPTRVAPHPQRPSRERRRATAQEEQRQHPRRMAPRSRNHSE